MADALASGASVLRDVGVQVPLRAQRAVQVVIKREVRLRKCNLTSLFVAAADVRSACIRFGGTCER